MKKKLGIKCPKCGAKIRFDVKSEYPKYKALFTLQCTQCDYYEYYDLLKEEPPEFDINKGKTIYPSPPLSQSNLPK